MRYFIEKLKKAEENKFFELKIFSEFLFTHFQTLFFHPDKRGDGFMAWAYIIYRNRVYVHLGISRMSRMMKVMRISDLNFYYYDAILH